MYYVATMQVYGEEGEKRVEKHRAKSRRVVASDVSKKQAAYISEHAHAFNGVSIESRTIRDYPYGALAAHALGYTGQVSPQELLEMPEGRDVVAGDIVGKNGVRENGVKYASCGLIWREFGYDVINKLANNELSQNDVDRIFDEIDSFIVQPIDAFDNGQNFDKTSSSNFRYIPNFNPNI